MVPHTRDGRVMFAVPWNGHVVVGTTDTPISDVSLEPRPQKQEVDFILQTAGRYMARSPTRADILSVFTGIRPLVKAGTDGNTAALSRDHTIQISSSGLLTIAGGKWTTCRKMAEDAVNQAGKLASLPQQPCMTMNLPVHGSGHPRNKPDPLANYGSDAELIEELIREEPALAALLHESLPICAAQIVWAARHEMARTVEDVLARRTRALFLNVRAALAMAPAAARLLAATLGRDTNWEEQQLTRFREIAAGFLPPQADFK